MAELKYVDWDGLVYYDGKIKQYIQDRDENYVKMGGIVSFNELPDPTYYNLHYIYKITDDFTSNSRFDEAGLVYKAGTWVQCVDLHEDASRYRYIIFNEEIIGGTADIDLSEYYTKHEVDEKIEKAIASIETPEVDLNNYYTKEEVNTLIPDISGLVTKEELEAVQNVAGSNSVKLFAIESDLVDISQQLENIPTTYATKEEVSTAVESKADKATTLQGYGITDAYTRAQIDEKLSQISSGGSIDLDGYVSEDEWNSRIENYATKEQLDAVDAKIPTDYLTSIPDEYITRDELDAEGYAKLTDIPTDYLVEADIENKADKSDLEKFAIKTEINEQIAAIKVPTSTSELTNDSGFITDAALVDYAKRDELFSKDYNELINTPEIPSIAGLASEQFVTDTITTELTNYYTKSETDSAISNAVSNFLTEVPPEYVTEQELEEQGFLRSVPEEYVTKDELDSEGFIKEHQSLEGYATEQFVTDAISEIPSTDLTDYYTKGETDSAISEAVSGIHVPEVDLEPYATKEQVAEQVATKANNVLFTTDTFVTNAVGEFLSGDNLNGLTITEIITKLLSLNVTSKYSIKYYVDSELFAEQTYAEGETIVTPKPDPVKKGYEFDGWKINGFYITNGTTMPAYDVEAHAFFNALPDEPTTVVDKIMNDRMSMYQINEASETVEIPYDYVTYDDTTYASQPTADCFYQKLDTEGKVVESGYQHVSDENDSMYYIIALPEGVTFNENVSVKVWDETSRTWADVTNTLEMSSDTTLIEEALTEGELSMPVVPDGYVLWIDASLNTCSGSDYRFIIN